MEVNIPYWCSSAPDFWSPTINKCQSDPASNDDPFKTVNLILNIHLFTKVGQGGNPGPESKGLQNGHV